jgi:hypothetical protein
MFQIPNAGSVCLYQSPINMRWSEKKLTQLCWDEMGIDPRAGGVFLFYNSKRDQQSYFFWITLAARSFRNECRGIASYHRRRGTERCSSKSTARS